MKVSHLTNLGMFQYYRPIATSSCIPTMAILNSESVNILKIHIRDVNEI